MLNKARRKFILWAMVAMIVAIVVLIAAVNIVNWYQNDNRLNEALNEITENYINGPGYQNQREIITDGSAFKSETGPAGWQGGISETSVVSDEEQESSEEQGDITGTGDGTAAEQVTDEEEEKITGAEEETEADQTASEERGDYTQESRLSEDNESSEPDSEEQDLYGDIVEFPFEALPSWEMSDYMMNRERSSALTQYGSRYFIAVTDSSGKVWNVQQQQSLASLEYTQSLVDSVSSDGKDMGYVNDYKYRIVRKNPREIFICFLDCSTDLRSSRSLLMISVMVGAAGTLLAFFFILKMSRIAVEPVRISIEKQKQFITNAGHELKTPLTSIATNMDILTMDLGKNEWVDSTRKQVGRLRRLVENLVALSKMEEDENILAMQQFCISDVAQECAEGFEGAAMMNGIEIKTYIKDGLKVQGDPGTIQQLISILCDNAVKYASGEDAVEIRLFDDGKNVVFETENGWEPNVDSAHLDDLFERFYRGDPAKSSENKSSGHGLGLSIAKAIAEKNNAKLTVSEKNGHKIVFRVKFK